MTLVSQIASDLLDITAYLRPEEPLHGHQESNQQFTQTTVLLCLNPEPRTLLKMVLWKRLRKHL